MKILIVDDDPTARELLTRQLSGAGFTVTAAENGLAALMILEKLTPDCIVSDLVMPQLDGLEFLQGLKQHEATRRIPVVILTSSDVPAHALKAMSTGARAYLSKPVDANTLIGKIRRLTGK